MKKVDILTLDYVAQRLADLYPEKGDYQHFITVILEAAEKGLINLELKNRSLKNEL